MTEALDCACTNHRTEDDFYQDKSNCVIHGPDGSDSLKIAYLQQEHVKEARANRNVISVLRSEISLHLHGSAHEDIPGAIIAALTWCKYHNNNETPRREWDTQASRQLAWDHGVLAEDVK